MKLATAILKNLLLPKLEKDNQFQVSKIAEPFWESLVISFCNFDTDAKPVYAAIYSLELSNPEKVIKKLDAVYQSFINELAENYVLGHSSKVFDVLLQSENQIFATKVHFFRDLEKVIKKSERKRLKAELPTYFKKLTFEISDIAMASTLKKKGREDLKKKMQLWDEELEETAVESVSATNLHQNNQSKVISLYWVKYAVAACFVLGLGVWFYTNQNQGSLPDTNVVTAPDKKPDNNTIALPAITTEALAEVKTVSISVKVFKEEMGFSSVKQKIIIVVNNHRDRLAFIEKAIQNNRNLSLKNTTTLNTELQTLKEKEKQYLFDGKTLTLYISSSNEYQILQFDDNYYLKKDNHFFNLIISKQIQPLKVVTDSDVLKALERIIFDNE